jgi:uncharacterized membrane protein
MSAHTSTIDGGVSSAANRLALALSRNWLGIFLIAWGIFVGAPWLAPVMMETGRTGAGNAIYLIYSTQCHQLPERSFFLFGARPMYSLDEIGAVWTESQDVIGLRRFVGNPEMGWKVAWSDRMVAMWTSLWLGSLLHALLRRRGWRPLPVWAYVLLALPMAVDGTTHFLADITAPAFGLGFRDTNAWLAALTNNVFPAGFYAGDALGSFNSWMRLLTGALFGLGSAWLSLPYLEEFFADSRAQLEARLTGVGVAL